MDNAATTFPKPESVAASMMYFMNNIGASAGRSGHRLSIESGRIVYEARDALASFFNVSDPLRVLFTMNATSALNTAFYGILKEGDTVVTSDIEHNSTMRPLHNLMQTKGIKIKIVEADKNCRINPADLQKVSKGAKLVTIVHGNNVTGAVSDLKSLSDVAHENGAYFMTDGAQTAGLININMKDHGVDILCASGHKGLYGPQGTGVLILGEDPSLNSITTLIQGGTGSRSEYEYHPNLLPDKFEAGTGNSVGVSGLLEGVKWLSKRGVKANYEYEKSLRDRLITGLKKIDRVKIYASPEEEISTGAMSFLIDGISVSDTGYKLDDGYNIMCRVGLHCAPSVHKHIGTFPAGTVRLSVSAFTTEEDVDYTIMAVKEISGEK